MHFINFFWNAVLPYFEKIQISKFSLFPGSGPVLVMDFYIIEQNSNSKNDLGVSSYLNLDISSKKVEKRWDLSRF